MSNCQQDHAETFLHGGVLVELVKHDLGFGAALQLDDDAHSIAITFVADVGDVVDDLVVDEVGNAFDEPGFVYLIRNFGDDDGLLVFRHRLNRCFGAHRETSTPGFVGFKNSRAAVNDAVGREVRAFHNF